MFDLRNLVTTPYSLAKMSVYTTQSVPILRFPLHYTAARYFCKYLPFYSSSAGPLLIISIVYLYAF